MKGGNSRFFGIHLHIWRRHVRDEGLFSRLVQIHPLSISLNYRCACMLPTSRKNVHSRLERSDCGHLRRQLISIYRRNTKTVVGRKLRGFLVKNHITKKFFKIKTMNLTDPEACVVELTITSKSSTKYRNG